MAATIKRKKNKNRKPGDQAGKYPSTAHNRNLLVYNDGMGERCIRLGSLGMSEIEIAQEIGVARSTLRRWAEKYPDTFGLDWEMAKEASQAWWERTGRKSLFVRGFNCATYNKLITCRFRRDYSDKVTIQGDSEHPLVTHIIRQVVPARR